MKAVLALSVLLAVVALASADLYLHSPRGSNNRCDEKSNDRNNAARLFDSQNNAAGGYPYAPKMYYYAGSVLMVEWTNQHACGENANVRCELVLQYSCSENYRDGTPTDPTGNGGQNTCTGTITAATQNSPQRGLHESLSYYDACNARQRNTNLFIADRNIGQNQNAQHTRQNPGGNPSGQACQEEEEYYPYWHPTPFVDIAIMTSNTSRCKYYLANSENTQGRYSCSDPQFNNEADCPAGQWTQAQSHKQRMGLAVSKPDCKLAPWSRDNHLGSGEAGYMNSYNWTIPDVRGADASNCFLRLRYNMSSFDYDPWATDARSNGANSPVETDPYVLLGGMPMRLAIDTTQFGRTFQDRTHVFEIKPRYTRSLTATVHNLGVRGKRGNIAEVRNCMEYDFTPQVLHASIGDFVHFQWTGSNFEPAGNAGEGIAGTDRSNIVQMIANDASANYPEALETQKMFKHTDAAYRMVHIDQNPPGGCLDIAGLRAIDAAGGNADNSVQSCAKLNGNVYGYFDGGIFRMNRTMDVTYMSTRNNNFSNRSQKGHLRVRAFSKKLLISAGVVVGGAVGVGAAMSIYHVSKKNGSGFTGFRSTNSFGSRRTGSSRASGRSGKSGASGRSHGSHRSKSSKSSFGGSMI